MPPPPPLRFLSAWFCPFAQRAQIALEARGVPYEFVESLGWDHHADDITWHHWKSEELLQHSAAGLIPTLVEPGEGGRAVGESLVVLELVDELAGESDGAPLLPADPWRRAEARRAAEWCNKRICSEYYNILVQREPEEQAAAFGRMRDAIIEFTTNAGSFKEGFRGPLFDGERLTVVDCALAPHALRFFVLAHWRGSAFALPRADPQLAQWHVWLDAVRAHPAVVASMVRAHAHTHARACVAACVAAVDGQPSLVQPENFEERYLAHSRKYADGAARSKVAQAVRAGRAAHEIDVSTA